MSVEPPNSFSLMYLMQERVEEKSDTEKDDEADRSHGTMRRSWASCAGGLPEASRNSEGI